MRVRAAQKHHAFELRVQEIAEQSGITKPTLYYYFGSKQGLMETILEEKSRILEEMLEKAVEEPEIGRASCRERV